MKNLLELINEANISDWKDDQYLIINAIIGEESHIEDYVAYEKIINKKYLIKVLFNEDNESYYEDWMISIAEEIIDKIKSEKSNKDFFVCYQGDSGYFAIIKGTSIKEMY